MEVDSTTHPTNHDRQDQMEVDRQGEEAPQTEAPSEGDRKHRATLVPQKDLGEPFLLRRSSKTLRPLLIHRNLLNVVIDMIDLQEFIPKVLTLNSIFFLCIL